MSGAYYNDNDAYAVAWLRNLIAAGALPDGDVDNRSIEEVQPDDLRGYTQVHLFAGIGGWAWALRLAGWPEDRPVWTGSCPCQPLSSAGQGRGAADSRHLWPALFSLIAECGPPVVFGEQVASRLGREWLSGVRLDLEQLGYAVGSSDLPAASVAAPHIRQRLWWVAHAQGGGRGQERAVAQRSGARGSSAAGDRPFLSRPTDGLGDAAVGGQRAQQREPGSGAGPQEPPRGPGVPRGLADAGRPRLEGECQESEGCVSAGPGSVGGVDNATGNGAGLQGDAALEGGDWADHRLPGPPGPAERRLADPDGGGREGQDLPVRPLGQDKAQVEHRRAADGLADAGSDDLERWPRPESEPAAPGPPEEGARQRQWGGVDVGRGGSTGGVSNPDEGERGGRAGGEGCDGDGQEARWEQGNGELASGGPGAPYLVLCADGRWRRVPEPGIQPLAHGLPAAVDGRGPVSRVGALRGAGNAIVPQLAAVFIRAAAEAIDGQVGMGGD